MPKYRITGPDGGTYEITAPEGASEQQVLSFVQQQVGGAKAAPAVDAPRSGIVMGLRDPIDAGAQILRRVVGDKVGGAVDTFGNWLADKGLPVARSSGVEGVDKIVEDVNKGYEGNRRAQAQTVSGLVTGEQPEPGFDYARLAGNLANPVNYIGGGAVAGARTVGQLAAAGAKAGAVAGVLQPVVEGTENFWEKKAGQAAAGAATGAIATPAISKGAEKAATAVKGVMNSVRPAPDAARVQIATANILNTQGMKPGDVPAEILQSVQRQVDEAMRQGAKLDPAAIMRRAQFEAVGLTDDAAPTLGQLTRDPMQWANEKNLSGVRLNTSKGSANPLADRFQAQNNRLQEVFDNVGARQATDRVTAGQTITDALRKADEPVKAGVDEAYTAARAMTGGRAAELDRGTFSQSANEALDKGMWGHFVPAEIRGVLNDISSGKTPFTVETAEQVESILSAAQRRAGQGSPQASAIGVIRKALHDTPFMPAAQEAGESAAAAAARTVDDLGAPIVDVPFRPAGGPQKALPPPSGGAVSFQIPQPQPGAAIDEGAAAREAFAQARAAARQRFATIEDTPALKAALDGEAPDKFVQRYVLGASVQELQAMKKVLANSPEALAQARAQVAEHLKHAAFRANASGDGGFNAASYNELLRTIGPEKLKVFFSPAELVRLNLAGKVASDITTKPAGAMYATNTSGTGAAVMNLLSKIAESPMLRNVPGARMLANQVGEIQTEKAMQQALTAPAAKEGTKLSPEAVRALQLLFSPAGVAGGVLGGSAVGQ